MYCQNIFFLTKHCTDYSVHFHNVLSSRVNHTLNKTAMMHLYPCLVQCQLANRMLSWCAISAERVSSWCGFILQALNLLRYIDGLCLVALPAGDGYVYVWVGILLVGKQRDKGKKKKKKGQQVRVSGSRRTGVSHPSLAWWSAASNTLLDLSEGLADYRQSPSLAESVCASINHYLCMYFV